MGTAEARARETWVKVGGAALLTGKPASMDIIYDTMIAFAAAETAALREAIEQWKKLALDRGWQPRAALEPPAVS